MPQILTDIRYPKIEEYYMAGYNDQEIDKMLNACRGTTYRWRRRNKLPSNWFYVRHNRLYAIHNRRTDELLFVGTAKECVTALNYKSLASFYRVYHRYKTTGTGKYAIDVLADSDAELENENPDKI